LLAIPDLTRAPGDTSLGRIFAVLRLLAKRDSFVFIFAVLTAAQLPLVAFGLFALGTVGMLVGVVANERALARQSIQA